MDSSATSNEKAAGRDACRTRYITWPVGQTLISLQGTGASPSSPSYSRPEDALKPAWGKKEVFSAEGGQKAPIASRDSNKKAGGARAKKLKRREAGGDTGSGDHGPLPLAETGESVRGAMWLCISYPDMVKSGTSCPAPLPL